MYRVIIADDEKSIRNGIVCLVDWKALDCDIVGECSNGIQVLDILNEKQVDIVVSDIKMPVMDGLTLAKSLHKQYPDTAVIILTAYSEFNYAKEALQSGVQDYIIKNEFMSQLPEAVEKAKLTLSKRAGFRKAQQLNEKNMKAYLLESMVLGKLPPLENGAAAYGLDKKRYCVCYCRFTYEKEEKAKPDILKAMENFLGMASMNFEHYLINSSLDNMTILFVRGEDESFEVKDVLILFSEIMHITEEFMRVYIKAGISSICSAEQLRQGYEEARQALFTIASPGNEVALYSARQADAGWRDTFTAAMNTAVKMLFAKEYARAEISQKEMRDCLGHAGIPLETLRANVINFCAMIFRGLDEQYELEGLQKRETEVYNRIYAADTLYNLMEICDENFAWAKEILDSNNLDKHYLVQVINDYIKKNCCHNISLQQMSEEIHVSASYISRLYKKKTGMNLTAAINHLRIQKAKELLDTTTYKIYEIAQMVGIEDPGYFTNIFIKYEGLSPSEYRGMENKING
ncbi:response regulator [Blautia schinkii]|nr:response regulator [Blautia schinkii]